MRKPEQVLDELIKAVTQQDGDRFVSLCQTHFRLILDHFKEWCTVPQHLIGQPEKLNEYVHVLVQTAQLFHQSGHPELLACIMPSDDDNPLTQWHQRLHALQQLADVGDHEKCLLEMESFLNELEQSGTSGPGLIDIRARVHGLRGTVLFQLNRFEEARVATALALEDCKRGGDEEGIRVYSASLETLDTHVASPELIALEIELLEAVSNAQRLTDFHRFKASNKVLSGLLSIGGEATAIVDRLRPHVLSRMGFNEFMLGDRGRAAELVKSARDLCNQRGDQVAAEVYAENLRTVEAGTSGPPVQSKPSRPWWRFWKR